MNIKKLPDFLNAMISLFIYYRDFLYCNSMRNILLYKNLIFCKVMKESTGIWCSKAWFIETHTFSVVSSSCKIYYYFAANNI